MSNRVFKTPPGSPERAAEKRRYMSEYNRRHRESLRDKQRKWAAARRKANPLCTMLSGAKFRAKKAGVPFTITAKDVACPRRCPILGVVLEYHDKTPESFPRWATLDRFFPELGYVPGNVFVLSMRANCIKNDATADELVKVAEWVRAFS